MFGKSPVWIAQGLAPSASINLNPQGIPIAYPSMQIIWEEGPGQDPQVTAQVTNLSNGGIGWWSSVTQPSLSDELTFTGDMSGDQSPDAFYGYRSTLYIMEAGCFRFDVKWGSPGSTPGEWYTIFAAGGSA
jgi:hypothetical protein